MSVPFDRIADRFDQTRGYPEHVMADILSALESVLDTREAVLDAGVGTGRFALPLQAKGFRVVGVDLSPRMLEKAREKSVADLVRGDLRALPFRDLMFGAAISIHVLHLISDWRAALAEIGRVTRGIYVSVAFEKEDSPAQRIRDYYDEVCAKLGYDTSHPGMRERELPDLLPPDTQRPIIQHEHEVDVESLISDYESRTYSSQWTVPEDIHSEAIDAMRERYGNEATAKGIERISLLTWKAERLRDLARTTTRMFP
jgi:SAM-dependent methyltransferase